MKGLGKMISIVYQGRANGSMFLYQPKYLAQRSMFEQKRIKRIIATRWKY